MMQEIARGGILLSFHILLERFELVYPFFTKNIALLATPHKASSVRVTEQSPFSHRVY